MHQSQILGAYTCIQFLCFVGNLSVIRLLPVSTLILTNIPCLPYDSRPSSLRLAEVKHYFSPWDFNWFVFDLPWRKLYFPVPWNLDQRFRTWIIALVGVSKLQLGMALLSLCCFCLLILEISDLNFSSCTVNFQLDTYFSLRSTRTRKALRSPTLVLALGKIIKHALQ